MANKWVGMLMAEGLWNFSLFVFTFNYFGKERNDEV